MLKICLVFWKSEPQYPYKRYAYKKHVSRKSDEKNARDTKHDKDDFTNLNQSLTSLLGDGGRVPLVVQS